MSDTYTLANGQTFGIGSDLIVNGDRETVESVQSVDQNGTIILQFKGYPVPCYIGGRDMTASVVG